MQVEVLKGGWVKQGSVIAFPHEWQRPAKTEEWVYEILIEKKVISIFVEFIAFPWAALIDLMERGKIDRAQRLISALNDLPPKKTLVRATACQHIWVDKVEEFLKIIKITDLFWSHKVESKKLLGSIHLHPMALYPVAYFAGEATKAKSFSDRKYQYSFIGAYDAQGYISTIRDDIFNLPKIDQTFVLKKDQWHFESHVYKMQIEGEMLDSSEFEKSNASMRLYRDVMLESKVSLCPSGAGPNSIRLWESLALNSYPLILSDDLDLPENIFKNGFVKTKEAELCQVIHRIVDDTYMYSGSFFNNVNDFILNVTDDLFSRKFLSRR